MQYAIIKVSNGAFSVVAEGMTDIEQAKVNWHDWCKTLHNAPDVITACVMIVDEKLNLIDGCREYISHVTPEPVEE